MEPANILFVIAFIGLPIAFGIWALVSRRELNRSSPSPGPSETPQAPRQQRPVRRRRPPPQTAQPTVEVPATQDEASPEPEERTVQLPAAESDPAPPAAPAPEPEPDPAEDRSWSGSSGTTEELPIIGIPEPASQEPEQPVRVVSNLGRANQTQPLPSAPVSPKLPSRRPFYPPRYAGKSGGVVKRLAPLETQRFLAPRSRGRR